MENKKKDKRKKLLVIILLLLFGVTAGYLSNTYAKYASTINGSGTVTVAKWAFDTDNADANFTINLDKTYDADTLIGGKIAPGTSGSFIIELSNENTEVGVSYTVSLGDVTNAPSNIVFKNGSTVIGAGDTITGTLTPGETGKEVTVNWEWPYYSSDADDVEDTADGAAAKTMTVNATITGVQIEPVE